MLSLPFQSWFFLCCLKSLPSVSKTAPVLENVGLRAVAEFSPFLLILQSLLSLPCRNKASLPNLFSGPLCCYHPCITEKTSPPWKEDSFLFSAIYYFILVQFFLLEDRQLVILDRLFGKLERTRRSSSPCTGLFRLAPPRVRTLFQPHPRKAQVLATPSASNRHFEPWFTLYLKERLYSFIFAHRLKMSTRHVSSIEQNTSFVS